MSNVISPVREQLRNEILAALAGGASLTTSGIYALCPSASDTEEVSRVAYEMRKKGLIVSDKIAHPRGMPVNAYRLASTPQPQPEPIIMSEEVHHYGAEPFSQEPLDPENEPDVDSELVDYSIVDGWTEKDAEEYVGQDYPSTPVSQPPRFIPNPVKSGCHCNKISLPSLPKGYAYGGIKVRIESEHDVGRLTIATHDEGGGAFASIKASGRLSFDPGDLVTIGQVADALIKLHESMDKQNID